MVNKHARVQAMVGYSSKPWELGGAQVFKVLEEIFFFLTIKFFLGMTLM